MTYTGNSTRASNRVLTVLVVITILVVAWWGMSGGLDEIQSTHVETAVVSE